MSNQLITMNGGADIDAAFRCAVHYPEGALVVAMLELETAECGGFPHSKRVWGSGVSGGRSG